MESMKRSPMLERRAIALSGRLYRAMDRVADLARRRREVVRVLFQLDYSQTAIAGLLGVTPTRVHSILYG